MGAVGVDYSVGRCEGDRDDRAGEGHRPPWARLVGDGAACEGEGGIRLSRRVGSPGGDEVVLEAPSRAPEEEAPLAVGVVH